MNRVTITKYSDMKQIAGNVTRALKDLNEKYKCLKPYLDQIDQVEDSVTKLEQAAYKLDAYSKRLVGVVAAWARVFRDDVRWLLSSSTAGFPKLLFDSKAFHSVKVLRGTWRA
ncbi:conserved hypothetical protein [Ixodes scapularis]|uniref:Biogenesis of lysosome-related organelles complex 1 subunit 2 n=1 Tax=Ixodes scapularis TaxID=6945 RepID=B7QC22_IXOSC|nr:conserved hypothetical protein [Ixodes scapularis]|eukprot:XP_002413086.1 conserved hypothetical protein [Ixodes scapularis]